jgi:hypothetical protein
MKNTFLFIGGFLSCSIIVILLISFNIFPFNTDENNKEITETENNVETPEYIFFDTAILTREYFIEKLPVFFKNTKCQ